MDNVEYIFNQIHFASAAWVFAVPCLLMALDFATGLLNAWIRKEIKSSIMRAGLVKKFGEVVILVIGEIIVFATDVSIRNEIMTGLSLYISLMELISITENLALLGVPLPGFLTRALAQTKHDLDIDEDKGAE